MVTVTVDLSQYKDIGEITKETQREGMKLTGKDLIANLVKRSPVRHGLLKSWTAPIQTETEIVIQSPARYARWVNYGHGQQPGRFIPGSWKGDEFEYKPGAKTGMVLKKSFVPGKHFVEASISATASKIPKFFTVKG